MRRGQDQLRGRVARALGQQLRYSEPAVVAEVDVDQDQVRVQLRGELQSLGGGRGFADDGDLRPLEDRSSRKFLVLRRGIVLIGGRFGAAGLAGSVYGLSLVASSSRAVA